MGISTAGPSSDEERPGDPVWCLPLQRPGPCCAPGHLQEWGHTFSSSQSRVKRGREVVLGCKKTSPSLLMFMSNVNFTLKVEHPSVTQPNLRQILSGLSAKCAAIKWDGCVMMLSEWSSQSHTSHPTQWTQLCCSDGHKEGINTLDITLEWSWWTYEAIKLMYCKVMAALIGPGFYKIKKRCSSSFISLLKPMHFKWAKYLDHGHVFCSCNAVMLGTCPGITVTVMVMNIVPILYYCLSPIPRPVAGL